MSFLTPPVPDWCFPMMNPSPVLMQAAFDPNTFVPSDAARLGIELPAAVAGAVARRQAEFVAGRVCAQAALAALGAVEGAVLMDTDGMPVWPAGVVGSITHCASTAAAAVARKTRFSALGIDFEQLIPQSQALEVGAMICTETELARASVASGRDAALTVLFSLKESLYKALYPQVRCFFDFVDVEALELANGRAKLRLLRELPAGIRKGAVFDGVYSQSGRIAKTLVYARA